MIKRQYDEDEFMTTDIANLKYTNIAIPQNRHEAMLLAKEVLNQLAFIERCIDEAIAWCEADGQEWPLAA